LQITFCLLIQSEFKLQPILVALIGGNGDEITLTQIKNGRGSSSSGY